MEVEKFSYDNKIVKSFMIVTVVFGLVGMLVGLTAAMLVYSADICSTELASIISIGEKRICSIFFDHFFIRNTF
jgi:cbb3-type cytochrome oxidase subunit 1